MSRPQSSQSNYQVNFNNGSTTTASSSINASPTRPARQSSFSSFRSISPSKPPPTNTASYARPTQSSMHYNTSPQSPFKVPSSLGSSNKGLQNNASGSSVALGSSLSVAAKQTKSDFIPRHSYHNSDSMIANTNNHKSTNMSFMNSSLASARAYEANKSLKKPVDPNQSFKTHKHHGSVPNNF